MTKLAEYLAAVELLATADPDTLHGAIAVLLGEALTRDPDAPYLIRAAMHMITAIHDERTKCAH